MGVQLLFFPPWVLRVLCTLKKKFVQMSDTPSYAIISIFKTVKSTTRYFLPILSILLCICFYVYCSTSKIKGSLKRNHCSKFLFMYCIEKLLLKSSLI